jgi:hypothetical protein
MDTVRSAERRAFLGVLATTTAALAMGACGGGASDSTAAAAPAGAPPGPPPAGNVPPVWQTVPTIAFTLGVQSFVSIAAYVSDANAGDVLTITRSGPALPAGVSYDQAGKRFFYDGIGAVGSASNQVLTANDR